MGEPPGQRLPAHRKLSQDERAQIADSLRKLSEFFPDRCDERQKAQYFERICAKAPRPEHVARAVEHLIDSHESRAFPPFKKINERIADAARDAQGYQHTDFDAIPRLDTSEAGISESLRLFREGRALDMPPPPPDIRTDREHRRKVLGITPLTRDEIADLERKRKDRERKRNPQPDETDVPF